MNKTLPIASPDGEFSREGSPDTIEIGQWYWVKSVYKKWSKDKQEYDRTPHEWLGCVMHVGSNYLELQGPVQTPDADECSDGNYSKRVHFDEFYTELRAEPNPQSIIDVRVAHFQKLAAEHLAEVQSLTARLGVSRQTALPGASSSTGVAVLNAAVDIKAHELALIEAKTTTLPELFKKVEISNKAICTWLKTSSLPMIALSNSMKDSIKGIDDNIFNISLYAGLTEQVARCCDGQPADFNAKLHVMQRMVFMDEECLIGYRTGGMEFKDIFAFDDWISEPENRDRILPFPRCIVAMRVRRKMKERDWNGALSNLLENIRMGMTDKFTYLYIRNGEQVSRLSCDLDFDEMIFPDRSVFDPSAPMMAKISGSYGNIERMITRDEFDLYVKEREEGKRNFEKWIIDNPKAAWVSANKPTASASEREWGGSDAEHYWTYANPYRNYDDLNRQFRAGEWEPFDPSSVYYDDILVSVSDTIKKYNRIAVIIQGLFDRSEVLHPHPPVKTWTTEGFMAAVELVYDSSRALHYGAAPDIDAYIAKCNAGMNADSVVIGQNRYWQAKEAEKECRRINNDWNNKSEYRPRMFKPHGNPGPGFVAKMANWKPKSRVATFTWHARRKNDRWDRSPVEKQLTVPASELFNVSAYTPGDFKQFFKDPRTRAEYLKWAEMLIGAEEYWAGNVVAQESIGVEK